jgi:hypothetical protein
MESGQQQQSLQGKELVIGSSTILQFTTAVLTLRKSAQWRGRIPDALTAANDMQEKHWLFSDNLRLQIPIPCSFYHSS